jgi:ferrous iron transport protein A
MITSKLIEFKDLKKGMRARVSRVYCNCTCTLRLQEMGLTEGALFTVVKVAPLGDPIEIDLRGYRLCLRKCETCGFDIELVD